MPLLGFLGFVWPNVAGVSDDSRLWDPQEVHGGRLLSWRWVLHAGFWRKQEDNVFAISWRKQYLFDFD